jgi:hypothetical protein
MKNYFNYLFVFILVFSLASCEEERILYTGGGDAPALSFDSESKTVGICKPTIPVTIEVTKASNEARTINFTVNADETDAPSNEYSFASTSVTIPAGEYLGSTDLTIDFNAIPEGAARELVIDLQIPEGSSLNARGTQTISYASACTETEVVFDFVFDQYPEEFVYQVFDQDGNFLFGDSAFGNYAGLESFSTSSCLPSGTYFLRLLDGFGDGFCCAFGTGSATVSAAECDATTELLFISEQHNGGELVEQFIVP